MSAPKAKVYRINIAGTTHLVYALTTQGAIKNLLDHLDGDGTLDVRLATGEELFAAGKAGLTLVAEENYKRVTDPAQSNLPITETDRAGA
jgi:hypothetical protein